MFTLAGIFTHFEVLIRFIIILINRHRTMQSYYYFCADTLIEANLIIFVISLNRWMVSNDCYISSSESRIAIIEIHSYGSVKFDMPRKIYNTTLCIGISCETSSIVISGYTNCANTVLYVCTKILSEKASLMP